jgi:hypothetical protein
LKASILIIFLATLFSCREKRPYLDHTFEGLFVETIWKYTFNTDGRFTFQSEGHYGNTIVSGTYILSDSVIFLNPETEWGVRNGVLKTKLKIINSECVRDYDCNYYCTTPDAINSHVDEEMTFQSKVIAILDSTSVVKDERLKIATKMDELTDVEIRYGGIIVIKNEEYHFFYLNKYNLQETITHLTFVVRKNPFEIYQHSMQGDNLELLSADK